MKAGPTFGVRVSPDGVTGLVSAVERLRDDRRESIKWGEAGRSVFEQEFDQPIAFAKWRAVIADVVAEAGSGRS
jgi:hypothetical protein